MMDINLDKMDKINNSLQGYWKDDTWDIDLCPCIPKFNEVYFNTIPTGYINTRN
jgi:hypothetical protein